MIPCPCLSSCLLIFLVFFSTPGAVRFADVIFVQMSLALGFALGFVRAFALVLHFALALAFW